MSGGDKEPCFLVTSRFPGVVRHEEVEQAWHVSGHETNEEEETMNG